MKVTAASVCIFSLMAAPVFGADTIRWGTSGEWDIRFDPSIHGCFMTASYTRGEVIRIGFDLENKNGYLAIANPAWRSVEIGKEYKLSFEFDGEAPWTGMFRARSLGGLTILAASFDKPKFLRDFGAKQKVNIYYDGKLVTMLPLAGTFAGIQSVIQCQGKVDELAGTSSGPSHSDPFSDSTTSPASDPFNPNAPR